MSCIDTYVEHIRLCRIGDSENDKNDGKVWKDDLIRKAIIESISAIRLYSPHDFSVTKEITLKAGCEQVSGCGEFLAVISVDGNECKAVPQEKSTVGGSSSDNLDRIENLITCPSVIGSSSNYQVTGWSVSPYDAGSFFVKPAVPDNGTHVARISCMSEDLSVPEDKCDKMLHLIVNYTMSSLYTTDIDSANVSIGKQYFEKFVMGIRSLLGNHVQIQTPEVFLNESGIIRGTRR